MSFASHYLGPLPREKARFAALALAFALIPAAQAQSLPWQVDPSHTRVWWEVRHFGTSTARGRFDRLETRLQYDRATGQGEVSVFIDTASVSSGVLPLDGILRGEYFFASKSHPTAYFVSRRFRSAGGRLVALDGELTVRDVSLPFTLTAVRFGCHTAPDSQREVCGGDFEGTVSRGELGITYGLPFVGDAVKLVVQVEAFAP